MEQPSQLEQYIPVLMLLAAAIGFAGGTILISVLLGKYGKRTRPRTPPTNAAKTPSAKAARGSR